MLACHGASKTSLKGEPLKPETLAFGCSILLASLLWLKWVNTALLQKRHSFTYISPWLLRSKPCRPRICTLAGRYDYYEMKKQPHAVYNHITTIAKDYAFSPGAKSELKPIFSLQLSAEISIDSPLLDDFVAPCWAVLIWQCTNSAGEPLSLPLSV